MAFSMVKFTMVGGRGGEQKPAGVYGLPQSALSALERSCAGNGLRDDRGAIGHVSGLDLLPRLDAEALKHAGASEVEPTCGRSICRQKRARERVTLA